MKILINIDVPELGPAVAFYCAAFDLHLARIIDDDVAELAGASSMLYLLRNRPASSPAKDVTDARRYTRHWTPVHVDFVVDDIEQATKRAVEAGARQESDCTEWRGSRCTTFSDPFGHGFCLIEFNEDSYSDSVTR